MWICGVRMWKPFMFAMGDSPGGWTMFSMAVSAQEKFANSNIKDITVSQQIIILNHFQSLVETEVNKVNILLPFPLSLTTTPPLTTGCIKVMLKCEPKRQKKKKSTQRLSVGYACFLHSAVCSSISLHAEKPLFGFHCRGLRVHKLTHPSCGASVSSRSVNGINRGPALKGCGSELTSQQVRRIPPI